MNFTTFLILGGIIAVLILFVIFRSTKPGVPRIPVQSRNILTAAELRLYVVLNTMVTNRKGLMMTFQTAMSGIIEVEQGISPEDRMKVFRGFSQKRIDFVIANSDSKPLVIIELDDRTHDVEKDRDRDHITGSAGIPTLRFASKWTRGEVEQRLRPYLS